MTNEELISKYYDGNMQALYDLYEQNVGFIHSVAAAVAKDYNMSLGTNIQFYRKQKNMTQARAVC